MKEKIEKIQERKSYSHHAEVTCAEERRKGESTVLRRESGDVLRVPYEIMAEHVFPSLFACLLWLLCTYTVSYGKSELRMANVVSIWGIKGVFLVHASVFSTS